MFLPVIAFGTSSAKTFRQACNAFRGSLKAMLDRRVLEKNFKRFLAARFERSRFKTRISFVTLQMSSLRTSVLQLLHKESIKNSMSWISSSKASAEYGVVVSLAFKQWLVCTDYDAAKPTFIRPI